MEDENRQLRSWYNDWQRIRNEVASEVFDPRDIAEAGRVDDPSVMAEAIEAVMSNFSLQKENEALRARQEEWRESEEYKAERSRWEKTNKQRIDVQELKEKLLAYAKTYTCASSEQLRYVVQTLNEILRGTPWDAVSGTIVKEAMEALHKNEKTTVAGDLVMGNKSVGNEVNGVASGATGIEINKDEK